MKILFVDQTGQMGGGELSLLDVVRYCEEEREVALFSDGPFREALEKLGVRVHLLAAGRMDEIGRGAGSGSIAAGVPAMLGLRKELRRLASGFDVVYANSQKAFVMGALAKRKGQRLIWHLRDIMTADHFSQVNRKAVVFAGNRAASTVIANSQATLEAYVEAGGERSKAVVVYNGIDARPFDAVTDAEVAALRKGLNAEGTFLVGVFGRLSPWKGQHVAIDAIAETPGAHLVIVGEALFGEQEYAEGLRRQVREKGVEDRVHFLGFQRQVPAWMKAVDVVAHVSTAPEPFGRVIVEGMLAERPVIASRAGGVLEIVEDGRSGMLFSPGSAGELAAGISVLMRNPGRAQELAGAGRLRASQFFTTDAMMKGIKKVLRVSGEAGGDQTQDRASE